MQFDPDYTPPASVLDEMSAAGFDALQDEGVDWIARMNLEIGPADVLDLRVASPAIQAKIVAAVVRTALHEVHARPPSLATLYLRGGER